MHRNISNTIISLGHILHPPPPSPKPVKVQPSLSTSTFTGKENDMNAVQTDPASAAKSISGKAFGNAGDQVSVLGVVTAISGSGQSALLTVTLASSQASVNGIPAGATNSDNV